MSSTELVKTIAKLVSIPSVSGNESEVLLEIERLLQFYDLPIERISVAENRWNIFTSIGKPRVVLTTHLDVVPAPTELFTPRIEDGCIIGRGACDAKGIAACMVAAYLRLLKSGRQNLGLLFVIGEETDGIGAKTAAPYLAGRGIRYLVNGEPTENKLAVGHKGVVSFELSFVGQSCHSGYPELGIDANQLMIETCSRLLQSEFGTDSMLGQTTINIGTVCGGVASNTIAGECIVTGTVRTVSSSPAVAVELERKLPAGVSAKFRLISDPVKLRIVGGFEKYVAAYGTDIPNFKALNAECLLYGPGSINVCHTDQEFLRIDAAEKAVDDYCRLVDALW